MGLGRNRWVRRRAVEVASCIGKLNINLWVIHMSDYVSEELLTRSAQIEGTAIGDAGGHRRDFG